MKSLDIDVKASHVLKGEKTNEGKEIFRTVTECNYGAQYDADDGVC